MAVPFDDEIRDAVAEWILDSAKDTTCLHELSYNWEDLTEEEGYIVDDRVREMFNSAKVSVVIDGVEYS